MGTPKTSALIPPASRMAAVSYSIRRVVAEARTEGIPCWDLLPVLEVGEREQSPNFYREGHPNPHGNQRIV